MNFNNKNIHIGYLVLSIISLFLFSCENSIELVPYVPKVVVEGHIENDRYASVILSTSASMDGPKDPESLLEHAIRTAKVTVSDGVNTEVLVLQTNNNILPPYEYKGTVLKGEIGKQYFLKIEYNDKVITSKTYIPQPVKLDSVWTVAENNSPDKGYIHIRFRNETRDYYQVSTRTLADDNIFTPCLYGNLDPTLYPADKDVSIQINKGPIIFPEVDLSTEFDLTKPTIIRFATQPQLAYKFWNSYQNEILNTQNPIFPANSSLPTNINGGIGIWSGYGTTYYRLD